jgi:hypothetical protein
MDLNRVVTRGDGLHIPFDSGAFEYTLQVVDIGQEEKGDENSHTAYNKSLDLSVQEVFFVYDTGDLNKKV